MTQTSRRFIPVVAIMALAAVSAFGLLCFWSKPPSQPSPSTLAATRPISLARAEPKVAEPLVPLEPTRDYYAQATRAVQAEDADLAEKLLKKLADPVDQANTGLTECIAEVRKQPNHAFRQALSNRHNDLIEAIGEDVQRQSNGLVRSEYYVEALQRATPTHVWIHRYEVKMISPDSNEEIGLPPRVPGSLRIDVILQVQISGSSDKEVCGRVSEYVHEVERSFQIPRTEKEAIARVTKHRVCFYHPDIPEIQSVEIPELKGEDTQVHHNCVMHMAFEVPPESPASDAPR